MALQVRGRLGPGGRAVLDALERLAAGDLDWNHDGLDAAAAGSGDTARAARALVALHGQLAAATAAAETLASGGGDVLQPAGTDRLGLALGQALAHQHEAAAVVSALAAGQLDVTVSGGAAGLLVDVGRLAVFMRKLAGVTEAIAEGDFSTPVWQVSESDALGRNLVAMQTYLKDVSWAAERIASGDLTVEIVPRSERDLLGTSFARMVSGLRRVVGDVAGAAGLITASSTRLADSGDSTGAAVREIAHAVSQVAGLTAARATDADVTAPAVDVTEAIRRLGARSTEIGGIVETITAISGQTNLLALNAAIEAARAGEQGRGFAVVAEEVRKLAEESKQSAVAITDLVSTIADETHHVVALAEADSVRSEGRAKAVAAANEGFDSIGGSVEEITTTAQALRETAEALDRLVGDFRLAPPGVPFRCALDADWTMEAIGVGIQQLTGYPASDFIGNRVRTFASVIHPSDAGEVDRVVGAAVRRRESYVLEYGIVDRHGQTHRVREHGRPAITREDAVAWLDGVLFPI
jgi:methyl-accepting chemotaxis protein